MSSFSTHLRWAERGTYANLIMGIIGIIAGAVLLGVNSDFSDFGQSYNIYKASYTLLIIIGTAYAVLGLIGIRAARRKNNCWMGTYNVSVFVFLVFSIVCLIVMIATKVKMNDFKNDTNCTKEDMLKDLKATYDAGKSLFCSYRCPCDANQSSVTPQVYSTFTIDNQGAVRLDDCDNYKNKINLNYSFDYDNYKDYLKNLVNILRSSEESFDCSGFCSTNSYYVFRKINDGRPDSGKDCKVEFVSFISSSIVKAIIITVILLVYLLIISYLSARVMFSAEKKENGGYYREKQEVQIPNQNVNGINNNNNNNGGNIYDQYGNNVQNNNGLNNTYNNNNNNGLPFTATRTNNSMNQMNYRDPYQQQTQMFVQQPIAPPPPATVQGYPVVQEVMIYEKPQQQRYPQLEETNQNYMNNMPPYQQNAKQFAKY